MSNERERWFAALLRHNGGRQMRLGRAISGKMDDNAVKWFWTDRYEPHHLRCVLPDEIVFDIGDCNDRECAALSHPCWSRTRHETHALWFAINRLHLGAIGGPSGGKGTHTHVFVENPDERDAIAAFILEVAEGLLSAQVGQPVHINADPCTIDPHDGSRLVREFGREKQAGSGRRKRLWFEAGKPFVPLPLRREDIHRDKTLLAIPSSTPRKNGHPHSGSAMAAALGGIRCPKGPQCIPGHPEYDPHPDDWFGFCRGCKHADPAM